MKTTLAVVCAAIAVVIIAVGCWFGYWAIAKKSVQNQYDINTHTQQYQAGLIDHERNLVNGIVTSNDPAQKEQLTLQFCEVYTQLNPPTPDLSQAYGLYCH